MSTSAGKESRLVEGAMSHCAFIGVLLSALSAFGQAGFETVNPAEPLGDSPYIDAGYMSVQGQWVAVDEHSKLAGPSSPVTDAQLDSERKADLAFTTQGLSRRTWLLFPTRLCFSFPHPHS